MPLGSQNIREQDQRGVALRARRTLPKFHVHARTTCRACGTGNLIPVLSLGEHCISNFVDSAEEAPQAPLELVLCGGGADCGLLQLRHTVEAGFLYRNYWYRSGVNRTMREALTDVTRRAQELVPLVSGDLVVDIGSNDGTLLKSYTVDGLRRVGFEPATNLLPYVDDPRITTVNDFFTHDHAQKLFGPARAKVITTIAMFYDLEDPNAFVAAIAHALDTDGVWINQMSYLPLMLSQNAFDNICHEHLEYYSLMSLRHLLARQGLHIIDVALNDVNGGSFRAYIVHERSTVQPFAGAAERLQQLEDTERELRLQTLHPYQSFAERVERLKRDVRQFIERETSAGKTVYVYGASTKGNTMLQYFGLDHTLIRAAAERNPEKWGKKTVRTLIPIISEDEARAERPDYFLVLPWHFLKEFCERERTFLAAGGKFIAPLPTFRVLGRESLPHAYGEVGTPPLA